MTEKPIEIVPESLTPDALLAFTVYVHGIQLNDDLAVGVR
jgi:hypothetical protein